MAVLRLILCSVTKGDLRELHESHWWKIREVEEDEVGKPLGLRKE